MRMKIGVLSDTHNYFDPKIPELFAGVSHILHAGDVGAMYIVFQLEQIAPVTAVLGNSDSFLPLKETEAVEVGGRKCLVHHIVPHPRALPDPLRRRVAQERPEVVVFGHTHKPFCQMFGGILYFNPGYAGHPRAGADRSVAILRWEDGVVRPEYLPL
jgi:uncharacterized protein